MRQFQWRFSNIFFFSSVRLTGVAIGTVVTIGSAPVFSGLIEWVLVRRRPTGVWLSATILAIIGCSLSFLNKEGVVVNPIGVAMSLAAGSLFAVYALVNKQVLDNVPAVPAVAVIFWSGGEEITLADLLVVEGRVVVDVRRCRGSAGRRRSPGCWLCGLLQDVVQRPAVDRRDHQHVDTLGDHVLDLRDLLVGVVLAVDAAWSCSP